MHSGICAGRSRRTLQAAEREKISHSWTKARECPSHACCDACSARVRSATSLANALNSRLAGQPSFLTEAGQQQPRRNRAAYDNRNGRNGRKRAQAHQLLVTRYSKEMAASSNSSNDRRLRSVNGEVRGEDAALAAEDRNHVVHRIQHLLKKKRVGSSYPARGGSACSIWPRDRPSTGRTLGGLGLENNEPVKRDYCARNPSRRG